MLFLFRLGSPEPRLSEQGHRRATRWFMNFPAEKHHVALVKTAKDGDRGDLWFHLNLHKPCLNVETKEKKLADSL